MNLSNINKNNLDSLSRVEFERLLKNDKNQLISTLQNTKNELVIMSDKVKGIIIHAAYNKWFEIEVIWNVIGFIIFASLDFKTYIELILNTEDKVNKIAIIRMVYTQIYEITNDLNKMTSNTFTNSLERVECGKFVPELHEKRKMLSLFKKDYEKELLAVRINVGAHRSKNYINFHDIISSLDCIAAIMLVLKFDDILNEFGNVTQKIMNSSTTHIAHIYENK